MQITLRESHPLTLGAKFDVVTGRTYDKPQILPCVVIEMANDGSDQDDPLAMGHATIVFRDDSRKTGLLKVRIAYWQDEPYCYGREIIRKYDDGEARHISQQELIKYAEKIRESQTA